MKVNEHFSCVEFPCADVRHECYVVPPIEVTPNKVSVVLISQAAPSDSGDYYYAEGNPLFEQTTVQTFRHAGGAELLHRKEQADDDRGGYRRGTSAGAVAFLAVLPKPPLPVRRLRKVARRSYRDGQAEGGAVTDMLASLRAIESRIEGALWEDEVFERPERALGVYEDARQEDPKADYIGIAPDKLPY